MLAVLAANQFVLLFVLQVGLARAVWAYRSAALAPGRGWQPGAWLADLYLVLAGVLIPSREVARLFARGGATPDDRAERQRLERVYATAVSLAGPRGATVLTTPAARGLQAAAVSVAFRRLLRLRLTPTEARALAPYPTAAEAVADCLEHAGYPADPPGPEGLAAALVSFVGWAEVRHGFVATTAGSVGSAVRRGRWWLTAVSRARAAVVGNYWAPAYRRLLVRRAAARAGAAHVEARARAACDRLAETARQDHLVALLAHQAYLDAFLSLARLATVLAARRRAAGRGVPDPTAAALFSRTLDRIEARVLPFIRGFSHVEPTRHALGHQAGRFAAPAGCPA